jgi:hypothetical protein
MEIGAPIRQVGTGESGYKRAESTPTTIVIRVATVTYEPNFDRSMNSPEKS